MKKVHFTLFIIFILASCQDTSDVIYKTKGGEFASKTGNFIADFPVVPVHSVIENQLGLEKFELHLFRATLGANKVFSIEYVDYPEYMIQSMTDEQLYNQAITNLSNKMADAFVLGKKEPIHQHGLRGESFILELNENAKKKNLQGFMKGNVFRDGNRFYTVMYIGISDKHVGSFLNSFRLINSSKTELK